MVTDEISPWLVLAGIDTEVEMKACRKRSTENWAFLMSRLASARLDVDDVADDAVTGASGLYLCVRGNEAMAYRVRVSNGEPQVIAVGQVTTASARGALVSEGQRRLGEILKARKP